MTAPIPAPIRAPFPADSGASRPVRVAVVQSAPVAFDRSATIARVRVLADDAAARVRNSCSFSVRRAPTREGSRSAR